MSYQRPLTYVLTPGLTPRQSEQLQGHLHRLTGTLREASTFAYMDADRAAGRWLTATRVSPQDHARTTIAELVEAYSFDVGMAGFIAGLAHGIRIARGFTPERIRQQEARASAPQARPKAVVPFDRAKAEAEIEAALRWSRKRRRRA